VTESQVDAIEEQWAIQNGDHAQYLAERRAKEEEKVRLAKQFGREPPKEDVRWALLNKELPRHAANQDWGLYRNARLEMGDILKKRSMLEPALLTYLEVCYLDLNGPNNCGGHRDNPELLREYPPFSRSFAGLAPSVTGYLQAVIEMLGFDSKRVEGLFLAVAQQQQDNLRLPVAPRRAWAAIKRELAFDS
jgi:hypothetical protein